MVKAGLPLFLVATLAFSGRATAGPCDALVADVMESTGARFLRFSPSGRNIFLAHPYMDDFSLDCSTPERPRIYGYWSENAFPPNDYFAAVAVAGERLTGEKAERIEPALRQCRRRALARTTGELASVEVGTARIGCHSFTRDGGSVGMFINKRR